MPTPSLFSQKNTLRLASATLLLSILLLSAASCGKKNTANNNKNNDTNSNNKATLSAMDIVSGKIANNELPTRWLKATLAIDASDGKQSQSLNADMRMLRDSIIWLSAYPNLMGFKVEVARALITRDSVKVIDRFNKKYYAKGIDYIQNIVGYPVDFTTLQRIIAGSRLLPNIAPNDVDTLSEGYLLKTKQNTLQEQVLINTTNYTPLRIELNDDFAERDMKLELDDYRTLAGKPFAYKRTVTIHAPALYQAQIQLSDVEASPGPLEMPFAVSNKYERAD